MKAGDVMLATGLILIAVAVGLGGIYGSLYILNNSHTSTDQAIVVQNNMYSGSGRWGNAAWYGNIVVRDFRNGFEYTLYPECNYYQLNSTLSITLSWGVYNWGSSEQGASVTMNNLPTGCYNGSANS